MIGDSALKHGPSAATADAPAPATTHGNDTPWRPHTHLPSERVSISNQQPSVRSKLPTQYPSSPTQQLQFHTPVRQPTDPGPDPQFTPGPPTLSPYTDPHIAPARVSISQTPITPSATLPTFQPTGQTTMIPAPLPQTSVHRPTAVSLLPQDLPYPNFPEAQSIQHPTMNQPAVSPYPTLLYQPSPQAPMLNCQRGVVDQLVLPEKLRESVKTALHNDAGHLGFERTVQMIRERFHWPQMFQEIKAWCEQCERCCLRKTPTAGVRAPLVSIHSSFPMELVCVDFLTLEKSKGGIENVLIVTDHFSRYAQAYPTKDQKANTVARVLWRNFFCRFGFPAKLHADQGHNFESAIVKELCKCTGITKTHTTPYHPQGNGTTERFNRTLMNMLGTLEPHLKPRWHEYVDAMTHAYNCTRHDSTGYTPYYLMFGRHPRLPVDLIFGLQTTNEPCEYSEYVQTLHDCLSQAYAQASQASHQAKGQQKKYYDRRAKSQAFNPGDRVLVKVCHVEGRQKLGDKWEPQPYIVVKKQPNTPVYVVRSENGNTERVVHRNLLTQCMFLPVEQAGGMTSGEVEADAEESTEIEDTEDSGEQAGEVTMEGGESDPVEALEVNDMEDNVEKCLPEITDGQIEHAGMEEVDVGTGQVSKAVEKQVTARGANLPPTPSVPRRS
ncbi:hypothetical protein GBF38_007721 [Nibea albiflora]|uniref:Uncharacterized protein n=1 Tax=Nibea albiflora TaxID=240163 RepID=A0ACB7EP96_NIBAL|nr:hypothetical protein GBF38_007721 [Nibea albiflora]